MAPAATTGIAGASYAGAPSGVGSRSRSKDHSSTHAALVSQVCFPRAITHAHRDGHREAVIT
ncbi:hypothetical protein BV20DRAFT_962170 [Pilatotrama ljubarskyi]|nr:hypothetical protein BV20DRAFT_962170 [Pilatotrama ljubarskyi]